MNHRKKTLKVDFGKPRGTAESSPLRSVGSWTVRQEAGPCETPPKALKTKLSQGGPSVSSLLRSDDSHESQAGG